MTRKKFTENIMNPENPNSPFFKGNTLKRGLLSEHNSMSSTSGVNDYENYSELTKNNLLYNTSGSNFHDDDLSNISPDVKMCSSIFVDVPTTSSSYDYNQEFNYNYDKSCNYCDNDTNTYNPSTNSIYDNCSGGGYDLYDNNTFNDDWSSADLYSSDNDYY